MPNIVERIRAFVNPAPPVTFLDMEALQPNDTVQIKSDVPSIQPQYHENEEPFVFISSFAQASDNLPVWGSVGRGKALRDLYPTEPILCGAVSSMVQKMTAMSWVIRGRRNSARKAAQLLYGANDGAGWYDLVEKTAQDYYVLDIGGLWELGRTGSEVGPIAGLFHLDGGRCFMRRNRDRPLVYFPDNGQELHLRRDDFVKFTSMPSPNESMNGLGRSAVSRAARAAKVLTTLYKYDDEQLLDMPPKGLAMITGMTGTQVRNAITQYKEDRERGGQATFPGVLWLASVQNVDAKMLPFSNLPEQFDREVVVTLYVYTLALNFGVDAREFWPATVTGATKADALVQAQKAKGKGTAELMTAVERAINFRLLPEGVYFQFDFQDDEEDRLRAEINQMRVATVMAMYQGRAAANNRLTGSAVEEETDRDVEGTNKEMTQDTELATKAVDPLQAEAEAKAREAMQYEGGGIITRAEARQLLATWDVVPEDLLRLPHDQTWDNQGHGFKQADWDVAYRCEAGDLHEIINTHRRVFAL